MPAKKRTKKKSSPARKSSARRSSVKRAVAGVRRRAKSAVAKINPQSMLINTALAVVGAIGAAAAVGALPKKKDGLTLLPAKFMPLLPVAGGLALAMTLGKKQKMVQAIATGAMVAGGLSLVRALAPQVPLLADEALMGDVFIPASVEDAAMLGNSLDASQAVNLADDDELMGVETSLADDDELMGVETSLADDDDALGDDDELMGMDDRFASFQQHGYVTSRTNM